MFAKDIVSEIVPILKTSDTGIDALNLMDVFKVTHLPIVNNKIFLGLISDSDIYDLNTPEEPLGNHKLSLYKPFADENAHIYEVMEIASRLKLSVVPVLNSMEEYVGLITIPDLLHYFSGMSAVQNSGSIIIIYTSKNDYSFAKIAQIIEENDAKILSSYMYEDNISKVIEITIKLDVQDISAIEQSLERFNYQISTAFIRESSDKEKIMKNFDSLMNYLKM